MEGRTLVRLVFPHRYKSLLSVAENQEKRGAAAWNLSEGPAGFLRRPHWSSIDLQDDIAAADAGALGRAPRVDVGDQRADLPPREALGAVLDDAQLVGRLEILLRRLRGR